MQVTCCANNFHRPYVSILLITSLFMKLFSWGLNQNDAHSVGHHVQVSDLQSDHPVDHSIRIIKCKHKAKITLSSTQQTNIMYMRDKPSLHFLKLFYGVFLHSNLLLLLNMLGELPSLQRLVVNRNTSEVQYIPSHPMMTIHIMKNTM